MEQEKMQRATGTGASIIWPAPKASPRSTSGGIQSVYT